MSTALQIALFLACVAVVLFVSFAIPLAIYFCRHASSVARQMEEMNADLKQLIQDSRATVRNVSLLAARANQQLDELDKVVHVVRRWSERTNHVVEELSAAVEAPVLKVARSIKMLRRTWKLIVRGLVGGSRQTDREAEETPPGPGGG